MTDSLDMQGEQPKPTSKAASWAGAAAGQPAPQSGSTGQAGRTGLRTHVRWGWVAAFCLMVCFIWGNSLEPASTSGALSGGVLEVLQGALGALGLPYEWLTDHIVRKCAHFSEYCALGLIGMQAFTPHLRPRSAAAVALTAALLVAVPSLDETVQLFVDGRSGQVSDVALDCSGAACGVALTLAAHALRTRTRRKRASV